MGKKFILFTITTILALVGCAKKEVPPVVDTSKIPPRVEERKEPIRVEKKEEKREETELARILGEERKPEVTRKEDWEKWRLHGRSTLPLLAIFFDYDDFSIREDMWDRIRKNVRYLMENPKVRIELQGNCDERGTNEYNMALGMKRALEVKKVLMKLGIEESRIHVISFGEERPLCMQSEETCWAINRRVDFVIK